MKRLIRLYPRAWRERYGDEFEALLDDVALGWRDAANIVRGALKMHLNGGSLLKLSAVLGAVGLIVGAAASFTTEKQYISTGAVRIESELGAEDRVPQAVTAALSRGSLAEIVQRPSLDLYRPERARVPMEDVIETMRKAIRIVKNPNGTVEISFSYSDAAKAEATVRALMNRMAMTTDSAGRNRAELWKIAWPNDPLPSGQRVTLVRAPGLPEKPVASTRPFFLVVAAAAGLLAGWLLWRPKRNLELAGFALLGAAAAIAASFAIPDRYTSSAVIRITAPQAPKRLWAALSSDPLPSYFQQLAGEILRPDNLARLTDKMHTSARPEDVRFTILGGDAFIVSFTSRDRVKAQAVVRELVTQFTERHIRALDARTKDDRELRVAYERMAGPNLEVLDPATLPETPVFPNRLTIGAMGLPVGLLAGVFVRRRKRTAQPA